MEKPEWDQSKPVKKGHSTTPSSQDLMHGTNIRHNASGTGYKCSSLTAIPHFCSQL